MSDKVKELMGEFEKNGSGKIGKIIVTVVPRDENSSVMNVEIMKMKKYSIMEAIETLITEIADKAGVHVTEVLKEIALSMMIKDMKNDEQ